MGDISRDYYNVNLSFDRISFFPERRSSRAKISEYIEVWTNTENRSHDGNLSEQAHKNLLHCVQKFVFITNRVNQKKKRARKKGKRSLKMITLTLPSKQIHTDTEIRKILLNQFLTELRQTHALKNYIWKAEKQENGNIHFHILVDIFIDYGSIREKWNRICNKLGYVDRFREGIGKHGFDYYYFLSIKNNRFLTMEQIKARWNKGVENNWSNPPSTEIKQVERVHSTRAYFAKYFSKETALEAGFGRIWFASRSISREIVLRFGENREAREIFNFFNTYNKSKIRVYDYATVIYWDMLELGQFKQFECMQRLNDMVEVWEKEFW